MYSVHYRFSDRPGGVPPGAAGVGAFSGGRLPPEKAPLLAGGSRPHFSRSRAEGGWEPPSRPLSERDSGGRAGGRLPAAHTRTLSGFLNFH